jgi:NADP-dependent 3-hydroxy acid dehydrogenase YdfG
MRNGRAVERNAQRKDDTDERQVVVITGASAGVGRATARKFAAQGARIGLLARGLDGLSATRVEVQALGGEALVLPADVADADEVFEAARLVTRTWGRIDVWVNNAMTSVFSPVKDMCAADYARVTEVTYLGTVHGTLAALEQMVPRDRGVIIQVGSALAYRSVPLQSAYCAAKHAIVGFTEALRTELLHDRSGVRVSIVDLPAMNTPQFDWVKSRLPRRPQPVPPIYQPEIGAEAIAYAASHARRRVDVGAPTVAATVANKFVAGLVDRFLARKGYEAQQTPQPADPHRPSNLWAPVRGDHGAHGRFSGEARSRSLQLWADTHRGALAGGVAALSAMLLVGWRWLRHA